jgi:hypothetical protein
MPLMVSKAALGFQPSFLSFPAYFEVGKSRWQKYSILSHERGLAYWYITMTGYYENTWTGLGNSGPHIDRSTSQTSMDFFMYFEMKSWNMKFTSTKEGWHTNLAKTDNTILMTKKAFQRWSEFRRKGSLLMGCMMTVHSRAYNIGKIRPSLQKEEENDGNWWGSWKEIFKPLILLK